MATEQTISDPDSISVAVDDPTQALAKTILKESKILFTEGEVTHLNILRFVGACMQVVERYSGLPGAMKKQLVILTVKLAIEELTPDDSEYELLLPFANYFIGHAIDEMVEVSGGKLKLNSKKFSSCFSCFAALKARFSSSPAPAAEAPALPPA